MEEQLLEIALRATFKAAEQVMKIYRSDDFDVELKNDNSPLTKADRIAHEIIKSELSSSGIPILSEEGIHLPYEERKDWKKLWIVDPIDGTKEFIKKTGEFTINIALVENQSPVMGVVYAPELNLLYWGNHSGSFKMKNVKILADFFGNQGTKQKLPLNLERDSFVIAASKSHLTKETINFIDNKKEDLNHVEVISKGSSLKICLVAEGTVDCYPRFGTTMEWDTAAGHAVCIYANATIKGFNQKSLRYNKEDVKNINFLCTNNY